jgi:hypothetical protein
VLRQQGFILIKLKRKAIAIQKILARKGKLVNEESWSKLSFLFLLMFFLRSKGQSGDSTY